MISLRLARFLLWGSALAVLCAGVWVSTTLHSPRPRQVAVASVLKANDPYALLREADQLSWLMNFSAAEPMYGRAAKLFRDRGEERNEVYARVGQLAAQTETGSRSEISARLTEELKTPTTGRDLNLRLRCLAAKAYADVEYDPASARKLWTEVLQVARGLKQQPWVTRAEGELGILALLLDGDSAKATTLFGRALFGTMLNADLGGQIRFLGILGNGLNEMHRYAEALTLFERAIRLARKNPDAGFPFLSYEGKAEALLAEGRIADARKILDDALEISRSQHNYTQESALRVLLGKLTAKIGDRHAAREELERAAEIAQKLDLYRMAADANFELAKLYTLDGSMSKARASLEVAVVASHRLGDLYFPPRELSALASLNIDLGNFSEADSLYGKAEDFVDERLKEVHTPYWQTGLREALSDTYLKHFQLAAQRGSVARAVEIIERVRGRVLAVRFETRHSSGGPTAGGQAIEQQIADVQLQLMHGQTPDRSETLDKLSLLEQQRLFAPGGLSPRSGRNQSPPPSLQAIQHSLRSDEEVLEYVLDELNAFCIAITRQDTKIVALPRGRGAIEELTSSYVSRIRNRLPVAEIGKQLYSALLTPLELPAKTRLIIVPDGPLHFLPFEALIEPSGEYFVRSHVVSYAPSAGFLRLLRMDPAHLVPRRTLLAVGGVQYQNETSPASGAFRQRVWRGLNVLFGARLENLPKTKDEVLAVGKVLSGNSTILLGADASETAFKKERLRDFRILHLAVHAVADAEFPDRAALVLGRDNNSNEDGLLQAREIMGLRLNADLVTLSACDTAFGKLQGEEGVSSLQQAFFVAGARAVVASLWTADDTATTVLMERFYRHLAEGADKAEALREAKLDLLEKYGSGTAPFYWAGFVLAGEGASAISLQ